MSKTIPSLDGLRAMAVLLVIAHHSGFPGFSAGFLGVDMFFVLSGFLITRLLVIEWRARGDISLYNFYIRRALRLLPALFILLLAYASVIFVFAKDKRAYLVDIPIVIFYAANWFRAFGSPHPGNLGHTWSLSIEEQYYMIWPALFLMLSRRFAARMAGAGPVLLLAVVFTAWRVFMTLSGYPDHRIYNGLDSRADLLLYGSALALWMCGRQVQGGGDSGSRFPAYLVISVSGALAYALSLDMKGYFLFGMPLCAVSVCCFIYQAAVFPESSLSRWFSFPAISRMGKISYGMYLWHYPITRAMPILLPAYWRDWTAFPVVLLLTLLASEISYRAVEKPMLDLKERYSAL